MSARKLLLYYTEESRKKDIGSNYCKAFYKGKKVYKFGLFSKTSNDKASPTKILMIPNQVLIEKKTFTCYIATYT